MIGIFLGVALIALALVGAGYAVGYKASSKSLGFRKGEFKSLGRRLARAEETISRIEDKAYDHHVQMIDSPLSTDIRAIMREYEVQKRKELNK